MLFTDEQVDKLLKFLNEYDLSGFWTILGIIIAGGFTLVATLIQHRYEKRKIKRTLKPDLKKYLVMYSRTKRIAIILSNKERFHSLRSTELWKRLSKPQIKDDERIELVRQQNMYNETINDLSNQSNEQVINAIKYQGEIISTLTSIEAYYSIKDAERVNDLALTYIDAPIITMYFDYSIMMDQGASLGIQEFNKQQEIFAQKEADALGNVLSTLNEII